MYRTMVKYDAIYPILFVVPPTFMFAFLSAGYGAAQNYAKVSSLDSDTVKPVKSMSSGSLCKTMKNTDKQAAVFCLFFPALLCSILCGEGAVGRTGVQGLQWPGCCLGSLGFIFRLSSGH